MKLSTMLDKRIALQDKLNLTYHLVDAAFGLVQHINYFLVCLAQSSTLSKIFFAGFAAKIIFSF